MVRKLLAGMTLLAIVGAAILHPASAQDDTETRLGALETQVAALETIVATGASVAAPGDSGQIAVLGEEAQLTIGGSALPLLPPGPAGEVSVIAHGAFENGQMPLVIRNNTGQPVVRSVVKIEFRDAAGTLLGVGDTDGGHQMKPYRLEPSEVALGFVYVEGEIPPDAQVTFTVMYDNPPGMMDDFSVDLQFPEVSWLGDSIVGTAVNPSDQTVGGTYMNFVCFGSDGTPIAAEPSTIQEDIPAGASTSFQAGGLVPVEICENFLVAATAHPMNR